MFLHNKKKKETMYIPLGDTITKSMDMVEKEKNLYYLDISHISQPLIPSVCDYILIFMNSSEECNKWKNHINGLFNRKKHFESWEPNEYPGEESVVFLNVLLHRFWMSFRESDSIKQTITDKLAGRLNEKASDKGMGFIRILDLNLGSKPPVIENGTLIPPVQSNDLTINLFLTYSGGLSFTMETDIPISFVKSKIPVSVSLEVLSLSGKAMLCCQPYPSNRYYFAFYEEPEFDFHMDVHISKKFDQFLNVVYTAIETKVKETMFNNFVYPNKKYLKIPGTDEIPIGMTAGSQILSNSMQLMKDQKKEKKKKKKRMKRKGKDTL
eukprot:TRINITY_DN2511_c0_g1_i2.p2 TRINITY_DN2511_c0_g1~~TRINITY_DN2511_c0_g1_i2.p2  ORF type:complete len:324 (+),score=71.92 TRINITY_DN2511_c0_g1_i2:489-1460(+)